MLWTQLPRELKVRDVEDFEWVLEMCDRYGRGWKSEHSEQWRLEDSFPFGMAFFFLKG